MIFQPLDDKGNCIGIYYDGDILFDSIPSDLSAAWKYSQFLKDNDNIQYAKLYCGGKAPEFFCPDHIRDEFDRSLKKLRAFYKSFKLGRISLNDHCFFDLVPKDFLLEYFDLMNQITEHVISTQEKPKNYDFLLSLTKVMTDISHRKLNINLTNGRSKIISKRGKSAFIKYKKYEPYCKYSIFGSKTGRLINIPGTFPLLTMEKDFRAIVEPTNDWFVELDYNGAELRTLLALCGEEQPEEDIHDWNAKNVFNNCSREEAKKKIFSWLYNPGSYDKRAESLYNRSKVKKEYWDGKVVRTRYNRVIPATEHFSVSYIIQSTFNDVLLRQLIKIDKFLENYKSHIAFCVHDSIIIDFTDDEKYLIPDIKKMFAENDLGTFKVNIKGGKNFGSLYKLRL